MGLSLEYIPGQTPIDEDELEDLLIKTISDKRELNEFEQANIEKAIEWSMGLRIDSRAILTENFIKTVHRKMFSRVWRWAGEFRHSNKNIGVDKYQIGIELKKLFEDCEYWISNQVYSNDEIAIRFKHRLVSIHPFCNGNGRHSRLCGDILVSKGLGQEIFTWGKCNPESSDCVRKDYIEAIRQADQGNMKPLIRFARS